MSPIYSIFWLTILSTGCLIEAEISIPDVEDSTETQGSTLELLNSLPKCTENTTVCGEAYRHYKDGVRVKQTFKNKCEFDEHNRLFGNPFYKLKDGPCDGSDCPQCNNDENPVCYSFGSHDYNNNRAFLNSCYHNRYLCLHGQSSVSLKMNDGRCQICKRKTYNVDPEDTKMVNYMKNNVDWQNILTDCVVDDSPLIAE